MGDVQVPTDALDSAQTQRAIDNFSISGQPMAEAFIRSLGLVKWACADANRDLGGLDDPQAKAITTAAMSNANGNHITKFPVDWLQTCSRTSTNMNTNEVIAHLASQAADLDTYPNDHVNRSESSNDVIPTTIHVAAVRTVHADWFAFFVAR